MIKNIPTTLLLSLSCTCSFAQDIGAPSIEEKPEYKIALDIQKQIQEQSKNTKPQVPTKNPFTQSKIDSTKNRIMAIAANKSSFKDHQITQYCKKEMIQICSSASAGSVRLRSCLIKNVEKINSRCATVIKDSEKGPPTKTGQLFYGVYIPAGSQFFAMQGSRSIGVTLSAPSKYKGIPISNQVTWFDTADIRSIEPYNVAVSLNGVSYTSNEVLEFFDSGEVKEGKLHYSFESNGEHFSAGGYIKRDSPNSPWKSL